MESERKKLPEYICEEVDKIINKVFERMQIREGNIKYLFVVNIGVAFKGIMTGKYKLEGQTINYYEDSDYCFKITSPKNSKKRFTVRYGSSVLSVSRKYNVAWSSINSDRKFDYCRRIIMVEEAKKLIESLYLLLEYPELPDLAARLKSLEFGGYIMDENNLSQEGKCFVKDDAIVCGKARVIDDAIVRDGALVCDGVEVSGHAVVSGRNTRLCNNVKVFDYANLNNVVLDGYSRIGGDTCMRAKIKAVEKDLNYEKTIPQIMRQATKTGNYNCVIANKVGSSCILQNVDGVFTGCLTTSFASRYGQLNNNQKRSVLSRVFRSRLETVEERLNRAFKEGCQVELIKDKKYQIFASDEFNEFKGFIDFLRKDPQFHQMNDMALNEIIYSYLEKRMKNAWDNVEQRSRLINDFLPFVESELYHDILLGMIRNYNEFFWELRSKGWKLDECELNDFIRDFILERNPDAENQLNCKQKLGYLTLGSVIHNTSIGKAFNQSLLDAGSLLKHLGGKTYGSIDPVAEYIKFVNLLIEEKGIQIFYRELNEVCLVDFKDNYIRKLKNIDIEKQKDFQEDFRKYFNPKFIRSFENSIGKAYQLILQDGNSYGEYDILDEYTGLTNILEKLYGPNFTDEQLQTFIKLYTENLSSQIVDEQKFKGIAMRVIDGFGEDKWKPILIETLLARGFVATLSREKAIFMDFKERYFDESIFEIIDHNYLDRKNFSSIELTTRRNDMYKSENIYKEVEIFVGKIKGKYVRNIEISDKNLCRFIDDYIGKRIGTGYYDELGIDNIWSHKGRKQYTKFLNEKFFHSAEFLREYNKLRQKDFHFDNGGEYSLQAIYSRNNKNYKNIPSIRRTLDDILQDHQLVRFLEQSFNNDLLQIEVNYSKLFCNIAADDNGLFFEYLKKKYLNPEFLKGANWDLATMRDEIAKQEVRNYTLNDLTLMFDTYCIARDYPTFECAIELINQKINDIDAITSQTEFKNLIKDLKDNYLNREFIENFKQFRAILRQLSDAQIIVKPYETQIHNGISVCADNLEIYSPIGVSFKDSFKSLQCKIMRPAVITDKEISKEALLVDYGTVDESHKHIVFESPNGIVKGELSRFLKPGVLLNEDMGTREILKNIFLKREIEVEIPNILLMKHKQIAKVDEVISIYIEDPDLHRRALADPFLNRQILNGHGVSEYTFNVYNLMGEIYKIEKMKFEVKTLKEILEIKKKVLKVKYELPAFKTEKEKIEDNRIKLRKAMEKINSLKKTKRDIQGRLTAKLLRKMEFSRVSSLESGQGFGDN